jgi:hypothetical protein
MNLFKQTYRVQRLISMPIVAAFRYAMLSKIVFAQYSVTL